MTVIIRSAFSEDVASILALVNRFAEKNITLPRTEASVRTTLPDWRVAVESSAPDGDAPAPVVGCAALVPLTEELVEIRSLAVDESQQGKGVGRELVQEMVALARERGFKQICALTLSEGFFTRLGFELVDRWSISPKVWQACIYCPKFHRCDEVAVLMSLSQTASSHADERDAPWHGLLKWQAWQPLKLAYQQKPDAHQANPTHGANSSSPSHADE